jgi:Protein of unknown function (DUF3119)
VTPASPTPVAIETIELSPSYKLPAALIVISVPMFLLQPWIGAVLALFALFLMYQTATLRLRFTDSALEVYRQTTLIRCFPYQNWQNWQIFWSPVPILFYFKEINSIHFLPILFDPRQLRTCLEQRCSSAASTDAP